MNPNISHSMFEDIFGSSLRGSSPTPLIGAKSLGVHFGYASISDIGYGEDALGREAQMGATGRINKISTSEVRGTISLGSTSIDLASSSSTYYPTEKGGGAGRLSHLLQSAQGRSSGPLFLWDTEFPERLSYKTGATTGSSKRPWVPVKQMVSEFFPGLGNVDTTREAVVSAARAGGHGGDYILSAARQLGAEIEDLPKEKQVQAIASAAYQSAKDAGDHSSLRYKRFLSKFGVGGLTGVQEKIFDIDDPWSLKGYMGNKINDIPKGIKGSTVQRSIHISGENHLTSMVQALRGRYGSEYSKTFETFARQMYETAEHSRDTLSFLLTEKGHLFIGRRDVPKSYVPLPAEMHGVLSYGHKRSAVKDILSGAQGNARAASSAAYLEVFAKAAVGGDNLAAALEKAHGEARGHAFVPSFSKRDAALDWTGIREPVTSRGRSSFYRAVAEHDTTVRYTGKLGQYEGFFGELGSTLRRISRRKAKKGFTERATAGVTSDIRGQQNLPGIDSRYYFGIKSTTKGVLAQGTMADFVFGQKPTERMMTKGIFQEWGKEEVTDPERLSRLGSKYGRISTVGTTIGEHRVGLKLSGIYDGRPLTTNMPALVGVVDVNPLLQDKLFGDAGALRPSGGIFERRHATSSLELTLTKEEARRAFGEMLGTGPGDRVFEAMKSGGFGGGVYPEFVDLRATAFSIGGKDFPKGAVQLTSAQYTGYSDTIKLGFATARTPDVSSSILAGGTRFTASQGNVQGYGGIAKHADIITGTENFLKNVDPTRVKFEHMTGLLGTRPNQEVSIRSFLKQFQEAGGKGIVGGVTAGGEAQLLSTGLSAKDLRIQHKVMLNMGFGKRALRGLVLGAGGMAELFPGLGEGISHHLNPERMRVFFSSIAERSKESEDVLRQTRAFSTRLETLNRFASGVGEAFPGTTAMQHPVYAFEVAQLKKIGVGVEQQHGIGKHKLIPSEFINPYRALDPNFKPLGDDVLSLSSARSKYVNNSRGVNTRLFNYPGIPLTDLRSTAFMDPSRKGFFLELGRDFSVPNSPYKSAGEKLLNTSRVWIPSSATLEKYMGGVPTQRGDLLHSIVGLLSGDDTLGTPEEYMENIHRKYAGWKGQDGFLVKQMSSELVPGAGRARLLQRQSSLKGRFSSGIGQSSAEEVFTLQMSRSQLHDRIRSAAGADEAVRKELFDKLAKDKYVYGAIRPTPTHGAGHIQMVRMAIDDSLGKAKDTGKHHLRIHPWLAQFLNRDMDKDVLDYLVLGKPEAGTNKPSWYFGQQVTKAQSSVVAWETSRREAQKLIGPKSSITGMDAAFRYFLFGNAPSLSFTAAYPVEGLAKSLVGEAASGDLAIVMNKLAKGRMSRELTGDSIAMYAQKMGGRAGVERAHLLQRNLHQAVIKKGTDLGTLVDDLFAFSSTLATDKNFAGMELTSTLMDDAVMQGEEAAYKAINNLVGSDDARAVLYLDATYSSRGIPLQGDELVRAVSKDLGRVYGVAAAVHASHFKPGMSMPNIYREGLSQKASGNMGVFNMIFGEGELPWHTLEPHTGVSQAGAAAANEAISDVADSRVLETAGTWIKKNMKLIGGAAAALIAYRAFSDGEMEPPAPPGPLYGNAPLPGNPMVGAPQEYTPHIMAPSASVMPGNGMSMHARGGGTNTSVNIDRASANVAMSMDAIPGSHSTINIRDSRRYSSNWEMQNAASRLEGSDFIHPYQS